MLPHYPRGTMVFTALVADAGIGALTCRQSLEDFGASGLRCELPSLKCPQAKTSLDRSTAAIQEAII